MEVSPYIDERYNWDKSTRAAAKYFKKAYEKYGTWTLAAASYNIGMNNVDNRKQLQGLNNYYDMQFPVETARYVYRAVAFKTILNNLKDYGFNLSEKDMYKPIETKRIKVTGSVSNWSVWAAGHNTNFKIRQQGRQDIFCGDSGRGGKNKIDYEQNRDNRCPRT